MIGNAVCEDRKKTVLKETRHDICQQDTGLVTDWLQQDTRLATDWLQQDTRLATDWLQQDTWGFPKIFGNTVMIFSL